MNLEDIAKLAGVSRSTVSRVVNNDPNVSDKARARVQATIDQVGYRPNAAARALASQRSHAIGLVVPEDFSQYHVDSWYPLIIEATLAATKAASQSLVLIMEDTFKPNAGKRVITQFIDSGRVDGLLVLQHSYRDHISQQLYDRKVPTVLIAESDIEGTNWVDNDNYAGGKLVAETLASQGVTNLLALAGSAEHVPSLRRIAGMQSVFPDAKVVYIGHSHQAAEASALDVMQGEKPEAIFAVNGWIAPSVHVVASQLGVSIPDDLLLIAFDDFDPQLSQSLGLTSVVQHVSQLADSAVSLLIDRVEGRAPPGERIVLESVLIPRGSCNERMDVPVQGGATP